LEALVDVQKFDLNYQMKECRKKDKYLNGTTPQQVPPKKKKKPNLSSTWNSGPVQNAVHYSAALDENRDELEIEEVYEEDESLLPVSGMIPT